MKSKLKHIYIVKMTVIVMLLLIAAGCSPQKRFSRLLQKHPELVQLLNTDTTINDTIFINKTLHFIDTVFTEKENKVYQINHDTVFLDKNYTVSRHGNTFSFSRNADTITIDSIITLTDTVYYTKKITVPAKAPVINKYYTWRLFVYGAITGIFSTLILIGLLLYRYFSNI